MSRHVSQVHVQRRQPCAIDGNIYLVTKESLQRVEILRSNLIRFREDLGLSQAQVSSASGIPLDNLRRYEHGTVGIRADVLLQLSEFFGVPMEAFYDPHWPKISRDDVPRYFLRTMPGVEIDQATYDKISKIIKQANEDVRGKRKKGR